MHILSQLQERQAMFKQVVAAMAMLCMEGIASAGTSNNSSFRELSGSWPEECSTPAPAIELAGQPVRHCAWSGRLEMARWPNAIASTTTSKMCVSAEAAAWRRLTSGFGALAPVWREGWSDAAVRHETSSTKTLAAMWREPNGNWAAVYWKWRPSVRPATRAWQAGNWARIDTSVGLPPPQPSALSSPLFTTWRTLTNNRDSMIRGDRWVWADGSACFSMRTDGISQAQLQLPYSRDDTRLEQRAAMQVILARKLAGARWLRPFSLIPPRVEGSRTGAKFLAVWSDRTHIHGQLWIPLKDDARIAKARISVELPTAGLGGSSTLASAQHVERELIRFAHTWEMLHE